MDALVHLALTVKNDIGTHNIIMVHGRDFPLSLSQFSLI